MIALRALRVIGRWVLWCTLAWASYYFGRLAVSLVRFPAPPLLRETQIPFLLDGIVFFVVTIVVLSGALATLLVVPYAFVVARRPQWRFWGETLPIGRVLVWLAAIFVPAGLILGALAPTVRTTVTTVSGGMNAPAAPDPAKQRP